MNPDTGRVCELEILNVFVLTHRAQAQHSPCTAQGCSTERHLGTGLIMHVKGGIDPVLMFKH